MSKEAFEILNSALPPVLSVLLAGIIGQRLTVYWAHRQKRKELAQAASHEFFLLYGEFFAIWKCWNYSVDRGEPERQSEYQRELFVRVSAAEAGLEASLIKLASERVLSLADCETVGRFRQGYQSMREAIGKSQRFEWNWSGHEQYLAFKKLACRLASLVASSDRARQPKVDQIEASLLSITHNGWSQSWWDFNAPPSVAHAPLFKPDLMQVRLPEDISDGEAGDHMRREPGESDVSV